MKRSYYKHFEDSMIKLGKTKGFMLKLAYGEQYRGIDSAIPQGWIDQNPHENLYFFATDCTTSYFQIIDLRQSIPDFIAKKVIEMVNILDYFKENKVEPPFNKDKMVIRYYKLHDEVLEYIMKFDEEDNV